MQYPKFNLAFLALYILLSAGMTKPVFSQASASTTQKKFNIEADDRRQSGESIQQGARRLAREVADRVIADTRFEFIQVLRKPVLGMEVIDFRQLAVSGGPVAYARAHATVPVDTAILFGLTSGGRISIWLNRKLVYQQQERSVSNPREIAYSVFDFDTSFSCIMKAGDNEMLIKYELTSSYVPSLVFLRPLDGNNMANPVVTFHAKSVYPGWLYLGALPKEVNLDPEMEDLKPYYAFAGKMYNWQATPQQLLPELRVDSSSVYQRDPYADWHYSHGTLVWSMMALDRGNPEGKYQRFAGKYCQFTLDNLPYFRWQYDSLYAFRGSYHRIFRQTMLDDTGAPGLPFAVLYSDNSNPALKNLVDTITDYIYKRQLRLMDGTFCRPEPVPYTIWADDLFMSVPYLVHMAGATGNKKYLDEAVLQAIHFRKYLLNKETGIYKHGWFSQTELQSVAYWGRANGWVAWATAELLQSLPKTHPGYKEILSMFRTHMESLIKYQDVSGLWHQLLDKPDSYEETSCTAMFTLAIARGVRNGWLNKKYKRNALLGWQGVRNNIAPGGIVHGICRGTEIGMDEQFYRNRKTIDNDPRGLGAVITAGIEIAELK